MKVGATQCVLSVDICMRKKSCKNCLIKIYKSRISSSWFCGKDSKLMRTHVLAAVTAVDTTVRLEPSPKTFTTKKKVNA